MELLDELKLEELKIMNINNVVLDKGDPFACISVTRDNNGNIIILNKTEEVNLIILTYRK